jgi:hypothetical protein
MGIGMRGGKMNEKSSSSKLRITTSRSYKLSRAFESLSTITFPYHFQFHIVVGAQTAEIEAG